MNSEQYDAVFAAEQDASNDLNKLIWLCAGLFGNIIGVLIAYLYQSNPPLTRLYEKSEEYKLFYTDAYKDKLRSGQLTYALIGLAVIVGFYIFVFGAIVMMQLSFLNLHKNY